MNDFINEILIKIDLVQLSHIYLHVLIYYIYSTNIKWDNILKFYYSVTHTYTYVKYDINVWNTEILNWTALETYFSTIVQDLTSSSFLNNFYCFSYLLLFNLVCDFFAEKSSAFSILIFYDLIEISASWRKKMHVGKIFTKRKLLYTSATLQKKRK